MVRWMKYKEVVPIGTALIVGATTFGLGVIYGNWPYDLDTLWRHSVTDGFDKSLAHYQTWGNAPMYIHYTLHTVGFLGLVGHFIKLYKPDEEAKYFEYGSLGLFMIAIIIYLTNLRTGVTSCLSGQWGDVDYKTGLNVMAASQVMIILVLVGVLVLQGGLYYAQWYDEQLKLEFYENERREAAAAAEAQAREEESLSKKSGKRGKKDIIVEEGDVADEADAVIEKDAGSTSVSGKKKSAAKKRRS